MRSPYDEFRVVATDTVDEADNSSGIPYHARTNSLPFSYGQISKTSTPLRNGGSGASAAYETYRGKKLDFGTNSTLTDVNYNYSAGVERERERYYHNNNNSNNNNNDIDNFNKSAKTTTEIKAQPRLTSPLLVRKTLNSRSPTRSHTASTNTIANTYHYYGKNDDSIVGSNGNGIGGISHQYGVGSGSTLRSRTPTRTDLEDLLRQSREKVYSDYRAQSVKSLQPQPPPRRHQLATTPTPNGKYNYDFEFNLNLDELPPRRSNTIERYTITPRLQQYQTRDIPIASNSGGGSSSTYNVERNYHTISSSNGLRETAAASLYAQEPVRERPPLEVAYNRRLLQQQQQQRQQQQQLQLQLQPQSPQKQLYQHSTIERTTYGNGNPSSYGYAAAHNEHSGRNDLSPTLSSAASPIYATTTKKHITSNNTGLYQQRSNHFNTIEPNVTVTDYSSTTTTAMASPTTPTAAANLVSRPETPAFPVTPRTPYGGNNSSYNTITTVTSLHPHSPVPQQRLVGYSNGPQQADVHKYSAEAIYQTNYNSRPRLNSNLSISATSEPQEVAAHLVKFAKDSSKYWYKPNLSRDDAIQQLLHAPPGTFIVRDSTTYKNAYGLVLRVANWQPPTGSTSGKPDDLVRHFLIEPTTRGVRLKGFANEPVFTSLSALVYEHSINQLDLPCLLRIPEQDLVPPRLELTPAQKQLESQGAACNVLWLYSCETESLTGEEAIRKAIRQLYALKPLPKPTEVHFKVSQHGITLTDNTRKKFFRKHYTADIISFCAIDPDHRLWSIQADGDAVDGESKANANLIGTMKKTIFAFVARRSPCSKDNQCHVFCDLAINQPASAIVSFANKTLPTEKQHNYVL